MNLVEVLGVFKFVAHVVVDANCIKENKIISSFKNKLLKSFQKF